MPKYQTATSTYQATATLYYPIVPRHQEAVSKYAVAGKKYQAGAQTCYEVGHLPIKPSAFAGFRPR